MSAKSSVAKALVVVGLLWASSALASADDPRYYESHSATQDFVAGGTLHVRMSVGDLHITRSTSNQLHLSYTIKSGKESRLKECSVDFNVHGNEADLEFHSPTPSNTSFDVELEVPENTRLDVHEKVGDLTVEKIDGDKDLELSVGNIRVADDHPSYRYVSASTSIGDVSGNGYGEGKGWLGKTLKYHGEGSYELRARVSVGDVTLEGK
jgi:hypothetical protein